MLYLQDAVPRLQAAVLHCRPSLQDVFHQNGAWPVDGRVPGDHSEAQTLSAWWGIKQPESQCASG